MLSNWKNRSLTRSLWLILYSWKSPENGSIQRLLPSLSPGLCTFCSSILCSLLSTHSASCGSVARNCSGRLISMGWADICWTQHSLFLGFHPHPKHMLPAEVKCILDCCAAGWRAAFAPRSMICFSHWKQVGGGEELTIIFLGVFCRDASWETCQKSDTVWTWAENRSKDKVAWWTEDWLGIKRPGALSERHGTHDRQPAELFFRAHREKAICVWERAVEGSDWQMLRSLLSFFTVLSGSRRFFTYLHWYPVLLLLSKNNPQSRRISAK